MRALERWLEKWRGVFEDETLNLIGRARGLFDRPLGPGVGRAQRPTGERAGLRAGAGPRAMIGQVPRQPWRAGS